MIRYREIYTGDWRQAPVTVRGDTCDGYMPDYKIRAMDEMESGIPPGGDKRPCGVGKRIAHTEDFRKR